ncbi:MAG: molybdenum cofactor guanylyltransferase MobA [Ferrimonas sp.]
MNLPQLTLVILAGGQASRMHGIDKGLITVAGQPMVQHVLTRLAADTRPTVLISNRNQAQYQALGHPVYADEIPDYAGPLAGICRGLQVATTPFVLVVPCDTPCLPVDLAERMLAQQQQDQADIVIACDEQQNHPVIMLLRRELRDSLEQFLASGERKVIRWCQQHHLVFCKFAGQATAFANINTPEQQQLLEQQLLSNNPRFL